MRRSIVTQRWLVSAGLLLAMLAGSRAETPAKSDAVLPGGIVLSDVDFERHVSSLFSRLGCNAASCHGSFKGKGSLRLSLFGQSPQMDFEAVQAGLVDPSAPDESLLLSKPSGREEHGGGVRFEEDSWEYRLLRIWIAAGAQWSPGKGKIRSLTTEPAEIELTKAGESAQVRVRALFEDGDSSDVTALSEFRVRDDAIASSEAQGRITAKNAGATSLIVSYRGSFVSVPLVIPTAAVAPPSAGSAADNLIDEEINRSLRRLRISVAPEAGDAEFLRRATLDVLGVTPSPESVVRFLKDGDPDKRAKTIDALLQHPRRAALWATRMCEVTGCNIEAMETPESLRPKRAKMWHDWFRKRFAENVPYDQIAKGVLCATSRQGESIDAWIDGQIALENQAEKGFDTDYASREGLDLFWRRAGAQGPFALEDMAELVASAFLGVRMHCARCHQHPYDRWTQQDFASFANIFARVEFGASTELRTAMNARLESRRRARGKGNIQPALPRLQEVFVRHDPRPLADAATAIPELPKAPGGPTLDFAAGGDPRIALYEWLVQPDNVYFAQSFVNRIWAKYFGAGLVEPIDAFSAANPASHPRLLNRLADEFVRSSYDIAHIERLILSSSAYQRSSNSPGGVAAPGCELAHARQRPLAAEVLLDSINAALESTDNFGSDIPPNAQAIELAPNRFETDEINRLFRILGRSERKSLCDCDRPPATSLRQTIFLMSDPRIVTRLRGGRLARLLAGNRTSDEIVEEFYLATVSRLPDDSERAFAKQHIESAEDRTEAIADIVWALLNTREFVTNH